MLTMICTNIGAFITKWTIDAPIDCTKYSIPSLNRHGAPPLGIFVTLFHGIDYIF